MNGTDFQGLVPCTYARTGIPAFSVPTSGNALNMYMEQGWRWQRIGGHFTRSSKEKIGRWFRSTDGSAERICREEKPEN